VGDSRAIASVNGNVEILSVDHKPNNDDERKRITAAGGWVEFNRVNGKTLDESFYIFHLFN
jgi:protein phosphatase 2C family protein 2/3